MAIETEGDPERGCVVELDPPPARALQYYFSEAEARDYLEKIECHITNAVKNNRLRAITTTEEVPTHE